MTGFFIRNFETGTPGMGQSKKTVTTDVLIAGAGPSGTACALALAGSGIRPVLIDARNFPRDKVCGDAIPHRAVKVIRELAPELYNRLKQVKTIMPSYGCRVFAPDRKMIDICFSMEGYLSRRIDFDAILLEEVTAMNQTQFYPSEEIIELNRTENGMLTETNNFIFHSQLIIGCDGAHSEVRKKFIGNAIDPAHYSGAVRAYYRNIADTREGMMEIHLLKNLPFGYFWIFPLVNGQANVGLGMLSEKIAERKINLRRTLEQLIEQDEIISGRFRNSEALTEITGFGLPMGSNPETICGERFMLCGDAASLIDPATGEGIGNAMLSGMFAGYQAVRCVRHNDYSVSFIQPYQDKVYQKLGAELRRKYRLQQLIGRRPYLASWAVSLSLRSGWLRRELQKLF
ncbi:MAG: NAD(P)/FAD-dependent oxidoreductase [Bacteroidia bacterium]|nr:NAD(P)/FAD-dependent oxidoreductase [Bacteroidia bacterium]MCZ2278507.1 NAD(P)/FAD-dependent oxidoreductase [Bacteroidia bacterium]